MALTAKGQRTEEAFLEGARQVFAEKGFFNAKIADISAAAGRSSGSFYNYYDNKEQLLEELLSRFNDEVIHGVRTSQAGDSSPQARVRAAVESYVATYRKYLPEMVGLFHMSMRDEAFAERWRAHRGAGIVEVLRELRRTERALHPVGLEHGPLASAIVSLLESFCWTWMAAGGDEGVDPPDDKMLVDTLTAIWCRTVICHSQPCTCEMGQGTDGSDASS